jgi:hypothetical protein
VEGGKKRWNIHIREFAYMHKTCGCSLSLDDYICGELHAHGTHQDEMVFRGCLLF